MTRSGDIQLCKAFWSLAENPLMHVSLRISYNYGLPCHHIFRTNQ